MCCRHSLKFIVFFISFSWQRMNHSIDPPYHHVYFNGFSSLQHLYSFLRHGSLYPLGMNFHHKNCQFSLIAFAHCRCWKSPICFTQYWCQVTSYNNTAGKSDDLFITWHIQCIWSTTRKQKLAAWKPLNAKPLPQSDLTSWLSIFGSQH